MSDQMATLLGTGFVAIVGLVGSVITALISVRGKATKAAEVAVERTAADCPNCADKDLQIQALQKLLIGQFGSGGVTPLRREQHDT